MRSPLILLASIALLHLFTLPALAAVADEPVARVAALRDQAFATNAQGEKRALQVREALFTGDTIETGARARLQLLFTDNTIISLGRQTTFIINEYLWQPDKQEGAFHSEVKEGIFRVMGGKLTKAAPQNFTTKTPAATIGIRGSMYAGVVSGQRLSVVFQGGMGIFVSNAHGTIDILKAGYGTHVQADEPPPPATPFSGDDMADFTAGLNGTDSDDGDDGATDDGAAGGDATDDGTGDGDATDTTTPDQPTESTVPSPPTDLVTLPPPEPIIDTAVLWTPPTDGITLFQGALGGVSLHFDDGTQESINEPVDIFANWHNGKVLGIVYDSTQENGLPVFFFGDIEGSQVANVKIFGSGGNSSDYLDPYSTISFIEGNGSGGFLGTDTGAFYFQASGYEYDIAPPTQPALSSWNVQGVGQEITTTAAPRGVETWQGYVVGISEDIDFNRQLLTGSLSLNINKDTGNISGALSASDSEFIIDNTTVGGAYGSAYIADNLFAAILGGGSPTLKPHGNYLVTGPKDKQFMNYATWGYWEIAYSVGTSQYHNQVPGAMWVAGKPTSATDMAALAGNNVVGSYSGKVMASKIDTAAAMQQVSEVGGSINLNVNFANLGSTGAISGNMALMDGNAFQVEGFGNPGNANFNAALFGNSLAGDLNGTFYGPNAGSVGGNFKIGGGTVTYLGIFGGNR